MYTYPSRTLPARFPRATPLCRRTLVPSPRRRPVDSPHGSPLPSLPSRPFPECFLEFPTPFPSISFPRVPPPPPPARDVFPLYVFRTPNALRCRSSAFRALPVRSRLRPCAPVPCDVRGRAHAIRPVPACSPRSPSLALHAQCVSNFSCYVSPLTHTQSHHREDAT